MESLRAYNLKLLANILPMYVAEHFLKTQNSKDEVSEGHTRQGSHLPEVMPARGHIRHVMCRGDQWHGTEQFHSVVIWLFSHKYKL